MSTLQITDLFGNTVHLTKKITLRRIEARFKNDVVREDAPEWVSKKFTKPEDIYEMFKDLRNECKDHFITVHLDAKNRILCIDRVSTGSLNQSIVHPREVFKTALLSSATAIVLVHNHPSGDPSSSYEDREITRRLKDAGELIGIKLIDHIIIGDGFFSYTANGLL